MRGMLVIAAVLAVGCTKDNASKQSSEREAAPVKDAAEQKTPPKEVPVAPAAKA